MPVTDVFGVLLTFLDRLDRAGQSYTLRRIRSESILVDIARPGGRWEVEYMRDGSVEVERFNSNGEIGDARLLDVLFADIDN